jgi:hypothetical protein
MLLLTYLLCHIIYIMIETSHTIVNINTILVWTYYIIDTMIKTSHKLIRTSAMLTWPIYVSLALFYMTIIVDVLSNNKHNYF